MHFLISTRRSPTSEGTDWPNPFKGIKAAKITIRTTESIPKYFIVYLLSVLRICDVFFIKHFPILSPHFQKWGPEFISRPYTHPMG
jgi:hypothetical protein